MTLYPCIKFHLIPLYTFRDMLRTSFLFEKLKWKVTPLILVTGSWFLLFLILLMALYQCIKFYYIPSILLNICSRQKYDGRTDESVVVDCIPQICTPKGYPPWTHSYREHLRVDHNSRELSAHYHTHTNK